MPGLNDSAGGVAVLHLACKSQSKRKTWNALPVIREFELNVLPGMKSYSIAVALLVLCLSICSFARASSANSLSVRYERLSFVDRGERNSRLHCTLD